MFARYQWRACVEITDYELRWLWYVPKSKERGSIASIEKFEVIALPQEVRQSGIWNEEELRALVGGYLKKRKAELGVRYRIRLRIGLPIQNQFMREYFLPWVHKGERAGLIKYLAEEEIPIPQNELIYDYFIREEKGPPKGLRVVLTGIRKYIFDPIVKAFGAADFEIEKVCFSQLAWARAYSFFPDENTLLLREEEGQVQLIFYRGLIPEITRSFPTAAQYYSDEEWDQEIHRMLIYLSSLNEQVELHRIVLGQGQETEKVGQRIFAYYRRLRGKVPLLQKSEEIHSNILSTEELKHLGRSEPEKQLAVLGMAMEVEKNPLNDFWRAKAQSKRQARVKLVAIGLVLALNFLGFALLLASQQRLESMSDEVNLLHEHQAALAAAELEERQLWQTWEEVTKNTTTVGKDLRELSAFNNEKVHLDYIEIKGSALEIQGVAAESLEVQKLFQNLGAFGWQNAYLANYQMNQELGVRPISFTLKATKN